MTFYIIFSILIILISYPYNYKYHYKIRNRISIFLIIFISIFRFDVGYDYPSYYGYVWPYYKANIVDNFEPLSSMLFKIANYFKMPSLIFILFGLLTYYAIFTTLKKYSVNNFLSIIVYLFIFWLFSLGEIRQALALSITFWGYRFIESKSPLKYLLICILASLFHTTALIAIIIYPIYHYLKWWQMISLMLFASIVTKYTLLILQDFGLYTIYINELIELSGGSMMRIFFVIFYVILFILHLFRKDKSNQNNFFILIFPSIFIPFLFPPVLAIRVAIYFSIYYCLLVPQVLSNYGPKFRALFVVFLLIYFLTNIYIGSLNYKPSYTPYQMIFFIEKPVFK